MVKVSIVVPIYNAEAYLNKCINSLINQSLKDIEILLINDGSKDDSEKIIKSFKDERIKYVSKKNEGIGKTRNRGIREAKGKYIAFIDSDDAISLDFCSLMFDKAEKDKCDVVICDYYNVQNGEFNPVHFKTFKDTTLYDYPELLNNINFGPCNKIYNLKFIKSNKILFNENVKYEDVPFVCDVLYNAKKIGKVDEPLCFFNIHEGSQTTVRDNKIFDIITNIKYVTDVLNDKVYKESLNKLLIPMILDYTVQTRYIKNKRIRDEFIDIAFKFLNEFEANWRRYINKNIFKKLVLVNKEFLKIYCDFYLKRYR